MARKGPSAAITANQLKLHIVHALGPPPEKEKYSSPIVVLEYTESDAEHWLQTRLAADKWVLKRSREEDSHKSRKKKSSSTSPYPDPATDVPRRGPKKQFDWTEKWLCGRSGKYRDERKAELSPRKRRPNRHHPSHDGHEPGTIQDMAGSMLPIRVKEWIENRVDEGLDWKAIKPLLCLDALILDQLDAGTFTDLPESLRIAQTDVYNAIRRRLRKLAHLDPDGTRSLSLWKEKLSSLGYSVLYEPNLATGKGSPAAFMITPSEAQYAIIDFIRWLRTECGFLCTTWMIDCSDVEAAGITTGCGVAILIFLCFWHVMKAVAEQAKKKLANPQDGVSKTAANSQLRADAVADFRRLLNALTTEEFDEILEEIESSYSEYPSWLKYLRTEWLPKKERWCMAYRKDRAHYKIDTNNYVESWHHHLKTFYLKLIRKQRIDVLLHILTEQVEPDFRRSDIRVALDFDRPRLSKSEQASQQKARAVSSEDLDDMIDYADPEDSASPDIYIHTFTGEDEIWYLVKVHDFPSLDTSDVRTCIISCECPEFKKHELKCKHMFLASRITGFPIQLLVSETATQASVVLPPTNSLASDTVLAEKQATIHRIADEMATISRLFDHHHQNLEIAETTSKTREPSRKCPYMLHLIRTHSSEHTGPEKSSV
ncbi:hypothetical protein DFH06DRAFT_1080029 [Mycena polygramma]|nr:hypothetical protein DFH06DRAFT_1080029 [Mycena polygramma]